MVACFMHPHFDNPIYADPSFSHLYKQIKPKCTDNGDPNPKGECTVPHIGRDTSFWTGEETRCSASLDSWGPLISFGSRDYDTSIVTTASKPGLGPIHPPIQWVPGALSLGVKRSGREADYSPPFRIEIKNA